MSFENDFKEFLGGLAEGGQLDGYEDFTDSMTRPDFKIKCKDGLTLWAECKEKRKPYKIENWPDFERLEISESEAFIEDELSLRRLVYLGPYSFLLIKDCSLRDEITFYIFDILDIMCVPKIRNNRQMEGGLKGKWLLNLRWASKCEDIDSMWRLMCDKSKGLEYQCGVEEGEKGQPTECHGDYHGESIGVGGVLRTNYYRSKDLSEK